ncbi:MAG: 16S rRNA (cytidine(1402)-2'-O)-methyltransferase [Gemmatimonadota bacterium]
MPTGTLYIVATPLGHMGDLSPRAAETLRTVHTVAAEDTRRTQGLLAAIDAHPRLLSYHAHSTDRRADALLGLLADGKDVALVSDAGTPAISDPGVELVALAREAGVRVVPIPGPSAVATALSAAGQPGDRYLFLGFVPRKGKERKHLLERAAREEWTVVFFEAPPRVVELLTDLAVLCGGDRTAVVARELTKMHEELRSGTLDELARHYADATPRGEVTLVLAGRGAQPEERVEVDAAAVALLVDEWLAAGESRKDIVRRVAARFNLPRNEAYRLVMDER